MTHDSADRNRSGHVGRTLAQTFCLAFGITLVGVGVLGFVFGGTSFDTGSNVQGEEFVVFEVNGWHNLVHMASGLLLLVAAPDGRASAVTAFAFGLVYTLVTVWGLLDGASVLGVIPVNTADNLLHLGLAVVALFVGMTATGMIGRGSSVEKRTRDRSVA